LKNIQFNVFITDSAASTPRRSSTFSSGPNSPMLKSSAFNEMFRNRASSYEYLKKARENALKLVAKRWQSCAEQMEAVSPSLLEKLKNMQLNELDAKNSISNISSNNLANNNQTANLQSEVLSFFDYCAKLIVELMKT